MARKQAQRKTWSGKATAADMERQGAAEGTFHLSGLAVRERLMEVCVWTLLEVDKSMQLKAQAGHVDRIRAPCKHSSAILCRL